MDYRIVHNTISSQVYHIIEQEPGQELTGEGSPHVQKRSPRMRPSTTRQWELHLCLARRQSATSGSEASEADIVETLA